MTWAPYRMYLLGPLVLVGSLCIPSAPLIAQYRSDATHSTLRRDSGVMDRLEHVRSGLLNETVEHRWSPQPPDPSATLSASSGRGAPRVQFPGRDVMLRQSTAGLIGGVAGALVILLPLAAADRDRSEVSDDVMMVGALLGYLGGSAVGVQYYSNRQAMYGSWWGTLGGSALGMLGGPLLVVTVPIGAMAGFNLTRED